MLGRSRLEFTTTYNAKDSGLTNDGKDLALPVLNSDIGEVLLMHGTSEEACKAISNEGFDPERNKGRQLKGFFGRVSKDYGALGQGVYFGDSFAKVQTYIKCPQCMAMQCNCTQNGEPVDRLLILARCLLGIPTKARSHDSHRPDDVRTIKDGKHSVVSQEGFYKGNTATASIFGNNEFLLKDKNQIYPEFIVYWRPA